MSPATEHLVSPALIDPAAPEALYRLSVHQYHQMLQTGVLYSGQPVELLEGLIVVKHEPGKLYRLSVEQYHTMINSGILTPDDRVELLEGWLVQKMSQNPPHAAAAELAADALRAMAPNGWFVRSEKPISLTGSDPEPDAALTRGAPRDFLHRHPGPADVAIVAEVSDTTLDQDRRVKFAAYAEAQIPTDCEPDRQPYRGVHAAGGCGL